jgi:hypothetical protein
MMPVRRNAETPYRRNPMTLRFTEELSLSVPADMRARVMPCASAWLCLYAFLTVGSIVSSI